MKMKLGKLLIRIGWALLRKRHSTGGLVVNAAGKWQPIRL